MNEVYCSDKVSRVVEAEGVVVGDYGAVDEVGWEPFIVDEPGYSSHVPEDL